MIELKIGQEVENEYGSVAKVVSFIGNSMHGAVYLTEFNGQKWILKLFDPEKTGDIDALRENIKKNIKIGPPNNKYIWPKYVTSKKHTDFLGYFSEANPDSFNCFMDILHTFKKVTDPNTGRVTKKPVMFTSLYSMVNAVLNVVVLFRGLSEAGWCYQDIGDESLYFNGDTGALLLSGCEFLTKNGESFGKGGISGYLAPEVVMGLAKPSVKTDLYTLSVILFKILFRGNPLEGEKFVMDVCLTEDDMLKHYGTDTVFVYDPDDESNRPVRGIHDNIIKFWDMYPRYIRDAFTTAFTEGLKDPEKRIDFDEWQRLFLRLRTEIISCSCGRNSFTSSFEKIDKVTFRCPKCGMDFATMGFSNRHSRMPLFIGSKFFENEVFPDSEDILSVAGELVENKLRPGVLGIKNCSARTWQAKMPDGIFHEIAPGKGCPIWQELEIRFGSVTAKI